MTDKISDGARELMEIVWRIGNRLTEYDSKKPEILQEIQAAITAARNQALDEVKQKFHGKSGMFSAAIVCANIEAMKVRP